MKGYDSTKMNTVPALMSLCFSWDRRQSNKEPYFRWTSQECFFCGFACYASTQPIVAICWHERGRPGTRGATQWKSPQASPRTLWFSVGSESGHWAPLLSQSAQHPPSVYPPGSSGLASLEAWGWKRLAQQGFFSGGTQVPKPSRKNTGCWSKEAEEGPWSGK